MTPLRKILLVALSSVLLFAGCGGDEDEAPTDVGEPEETLAPAVEVDGIALQETMPGFLDEVLDDYGRISPPIYVATDELLLAFVPEGVDPVEFCDRLSVYVAGQGFEGVRMDMLTNLDTPEALATGLSGGDCEATS